MNCKHCTKHFYNPNDKAAGYHTNSEYCRILKDKDIRVPKLMYFERPQKDSERKKQGIVINPEKYVI